MPIVIFNDGTNGNGGSMVNTGNGLSGDGSSGTPVVLGGTLTADTTIFTNGHDLAVTGGVVGNGLFANDNAATLAGVSVSGNSTAGISATGSTDYALAIMQANNDGGGRHAITMEPITGAPQPISVTDSDAQIGMVYTDDYSVNGEAFGNNWVPSWGAVLDAIAGSGAAPVVVKCNSIGGQTSDTTLVTYENTTGTTAMYRVSVWLGNRVTSTGTSVISCVAGSDVAGNTTTLGTIATAGVVTSDLSPTIVVVYLDNLGTITLSLSITGTVICDASWCIERLPLPV